MGKKGIIALCLFVLSCILLLLVLAYNFIKNEKLYNDSHEESQNTDIIVEYPETYELANIILALTDYGKNDRWEVRKDFDYYKEVLEYFQPYEEHPLIDSVNYSREKWMEYLSFRTDSYAFAFNDNDELFRHSDFLSNPEVQPFDENLPLINDFVTKTGFRNFFKAKQAYRDSIVTNYKEGYLLSEIKGFLQNEFKTKNLDKKYKVILSPFVYRMNCHRALDSVTEADFPTLPDFLVYDSVPATLKNSVIESHTLFTEMDHAYVNPTSNTFSNLIEESFNDSIWNNESGYEEYELGVFNEYMTWAVYDLFVKENYPEYAPELTNYWHYQNDSRGFYFSNMFAELLSEVSIKYPDKTIAELYPEFLQVIKENQKKLTKPVIENDTILKLSANRYLIKANFSESMRNDVFEVLMSSSSSMDTITIDEEQNDLKWNDDFTELSFQLNSLDEKPEFELVFNWWGIVKPLRSNKGVFLGPEDIGFTRP